MARILANLADGLASEKIDGDFDFDEHWNKYYQHMYQNSPSFPRRISPRRVGAGLFLSAQVLTPRHPLRSHGRLLG